MAVTTYNIKFCVQNSVLCTCSSTVKSGPFPCRQYEALIYGIPPLLATWQGPTGWRWIQYSPYASSIKIDYCVFRILRLLKILTVGAFARALGSHPGT